MATFVDHLSFIHFLMNSQCIKVTAIAYRSSSPLINNQLKISSEIQDLKISNKTSIYVLLDFSSGPGDFRLVVDSSNSDYKLLCYYV